MLRGILSRVASSRRATTGGMGRRGTGLSGTGRTGTGAAGSPNRDIERGARSLFRGLSRRRP